jgi:uncharacterized protein YjiS (DUF1127 family)
MGASALQEIDMTRSTPAAANGSTLSLALARIFIRGVKQSFAVLKNRREVARLSDLDDRALKDIGLIRSDVQAALAVPLFSDPSHHLMEVAGHKRSPSRAAEPMLQTNSTQRLRHADAVVTHASIKPSAC